ncbi:MAG: DNA topoisomerase IV subunit A [Rhodobacteraceae bacterium]|nr:DNA topoisomerase IV subunit A [Paracoccaceae bacterium]
MNRAVEEQQIQSESLKEAISDRYLQYALSTIMHRALPDARDGLKPVHRRILFAMRELKLSPTSAFRKSAKISGDVMGNFHPHGNQAIYDALVRLAQDFNMRYPLVDGQGNFGNIDGDGAAAERYTEARLTVAAESLLDGLDENAVEFQSNYDGTLEEPVVLPAKIPNLLANGASGIAVGMATNIPPHNIGELCDACLHLLKSPDARDATLVKHVPGPDFPTGGVIVEPEDKILDAYQTGRGSLRLRARWTRQELTRGSWQIVITEIPYQVQKSRLIERIAELIQSKKIQMLADIRDESAEDIRIVLEPRTRNVNPDMLMETLFRQSDLETRFSLNMNVLIDGRTPRVCSLKDVLTAFLDHRRDVLLRRSRHRLAQIDRRAEIIEGFITTFLNLDRVIAIIRFEDSPKKMLMDEFTLSEIQADAILNMRLRSLRKLEELELKREFDSLTRERLELSDLLEDPKVQTRRLAEEIREVRQQFAATGGGHRRTGFAQLQTIETISMESMIESEPITVICSQAGWIRTVKGHVPLDQEFRYRDGDAGKFVFHARTTDRLIMCAENGRFYTLTAASLASGRGLGEPVRLIVDLPNECGIVNLLVHEPGRKLLVASSSGYAFLVDEGETLTVQKKGKQIMNLHVPDLVRVCTVAKGDHVASVSHRSKFLIFPLEELPTHARGKGVRAQKTDVGELADMQVFAIADGLQWRDAGGRQRTVKELQPWLGRRGRVGTRPPRGFPKDGKLH